MRGIGRDSSLGIPIVGKPLQGAGLPTYEGSRGIMPLAGWHGGVEPLRPNFFKDFAMGDAPHDSDEKPDAGKSSAPLSEKQRRELWLYVGVSIFAVELLLTGTQQDFPVMSDRQVVGVLTLRDLQGALAQRGDAVAVGDVMRRDVPVVDAYRIGADRCGRGQVQGRAAARHHADDQHRQEDAARARKATASAGRNLRGQTVERTAEGAKEALGPAHVRAKETSGARILAGFVL